MNFIVKENSSIKRDAQVVAFARISLPDFCFACNDLYKIEDRTFIHRQTMKPYLEIHHVLSFAYDQSSDVLENLVKLCPACHKALSKNRALECYQKTLIKNIISNSTAIDKYLNDIIVGNEDKVDFVYNRLM
ncbi:HNH endonuclease [Mycoplasma putrefaciens]|uniref:HNH endonuclease n=1 Tax=Mycoplasma putrefaciens TaxID=2123 RepID=UPI0002EB0326|nr:HNH endonuclease [Mycoplasma putrefaciens]SYV95523.1 HNH endonuclease [Mycoplasma putrefaciens]